MEVFLNGDPFESFRLAYIPPRHDDYFFRPPLPDIPRPSPINDCQTVYAWPVARERAPLGEQKVAISIGPMVRWDIDFIGFLCQIELQPDFDIALSFAGEDRSYVEKVAELLEAQGIRVFYDRYFEADLWGADLYEHLIDVYRDRAKYAVMFISKHYRDKLWARHERKAAQARAFSEAKEYILPARFDDTEIPGLLPTLGYIDLRSHTPGQLVELIERKLADR